MNDPRRERAAHAAAVALLALLPLCWLWPSLFGGRLFVPYDLAAWPPASLQLPAAAAAELRQDSNLDVTEVPVWFLPEVALARQQLCSGHGFPGWNPCARTGTALHGHGLLGLLYPPDWLMLLDADPAPLLAWTVWLDLALAGLLAFGFLHKLGLPAVPALFGAVTFQLGGAMAANAPFWMRLGSLIWLPGTLWAQLAIADARARWPWPRIAALAVCVAMPWLAGFPPYALATTLLAMAFGAVLALQRWRQQDRRAAGRLLLPLLLGGGLGVLLALPAVLPSLLFFAESARPQPDASMLAENKYDFYGLLTLLLPDLFGHQTTTALLPYDRSPLCLWLSTVAKPKAAGPGHAWFASNYNYTEYAVFAGTLGLGFAAYGAARGSGRLRAFAVLALAVVLGLATFVPGCRAVFQLPGMTNVFPMRWLPPAMLLLAWLAALGCERLLQPERLGLRLLLVAMAIVAVVATMLGRDLLPEAGAEPALQRWLPDALAEKNHEPREVVLGYLGAGAVQDRLLLAQTIAADELQRLGRWALLAALWCGGLLLAQRLGRRGSSFGWLAVLLAALQLALHGAGSNRGHACTTPVWTPVHAFLAEQRQAAAATGGFAIARASSAAQLPVQLPPGELLAARVRDLQYDSHYDRRSHQPLLALFGDEVAGRSYLNSTLPDDARLQQPLLDLLGVRYVLATEPLQHAGTLVGPRCEGPGGRFYVYERPQPLPRAFVVPALQRVADDDDAVRALLGAPPLPPFDPRAAAIATPAEADKLPAWPTDAAAAQRSIRFVVDEPTEVLLQVEAGSRGCLVLADTWLPGWSATIDGSDAPIARVDHSLRGVALPAAACSVRFRYSVPGLPAGVAAAAAAALVLLLGALWQRRSSRRAAASDSGM